MQLQSFCTVFTRHMAISSSLRHFAQAILKMLNGVLSAVLGVCAWFTRTTMELVNVAMDLASSIGGFLLGEEGNGLFKWRLC